MCSGQILLYGLHKSAGHEQGRRNAVRIGFFPGPVEEKAFPVHPGQGGFPLPEQDAGFFPGFMEPMEGGGRDLNRPGRGESRQAMDDIEEDFSGLFRIPMLTATGAGAERTSRSSLSDGKESVGSRSTAFPHSGGRLYSNSVTVPGFRNRERRAGGRPPSVWMEISPEEGMDYCF